MRTVLALLLLATPTMADHCRVVRSNVTVLDTGLTIVPYAVATPVAVVAPGSPMYSYRDTAQAYGTQSLSVEDAQLLEEFKEFKRQRQAQVKAAVVPQTLLQQNCVKCHTDNADAKSHLDMSAPLTVEQKLRSIAEIMQGHMPKGKTLDPQVRADLVAELSNVSEKSK